MRLFLMSWRLGANPLSLIPIIFMNAPRNEESRMHKEKLMEKNLKGSKRGLTFSFYGNGQFEPGKKYQYVINPEESLIIIAPSDTTGNQISRKKCGKRIKSLIDIRSREIREMVSRAKTMKIDIRENEILVHLFEQPQEAEIIRLDSKGKIGTIALSRELLRAAGGEDIVWEACAESPDPECSSLKPKEKQDISDVIRVISLFSGAGMLDYPFSADKHFDIVYAAEYDSDAVETYRRNIGGHIHRIDIRTLTGNDLPNTDVIIGGPPCQPFSNANRHDGARFENHKEGDMFGHFIRLIRECCAKVFLIENVPGLLSNQDGYYIRMLEEKLPEYEVASAVVSDCDLGGYTTRKRAVVIGSRIGSPVIPRLKVFPLKTVGDALKKVDHTWPNAADITKSNDLVKKKISMIPEGGNWRDLPEELWTKSIHSNMYRRLDRTKPSVAIANWRKYLLSPPKWDDTGDWDRILSVSEAAALQGFKKDFVFYGSMNAKQQQVANGVTYAIGHFLKELVKNLYQASLAT